MEFIQLQYCATILMVYRICCWHILLEIIIFILAPNVRLIMMIQTTTWELLYISFENRKYKIINNICTYHFDA